MKEAEIVSRNRSVFEHYIENYNNKNFDIELCNQGYKVNPTKLHSLTLIKRKIRKDFEQNGNSFSSHDIEELFQQLEIPNLKNINKTDFLEFYIYFVNVNFFARPRMFGSNIIDRYLALSKLKGTEISWREFRERTRKLDIDKIAHKGDVKEFPLLHSDINSTFSIYKKNQDLCK